MNILLNNPEIFIKLTSGVSPIIWIICGLLLLFSIYTYILYFSIKKKFTKNNKKLNRLLADLHQSEDKYKIILDDIIDGYYEVDLNGNFTFCNKSFAHIIEYSVDEIIGTNYSKYIDHDSAKDVLKKYNDVFNTSIPLKSNNLKILKKNGSEAFGEISISLIIDSDGNKRGFRGIFHNITEQKKIEETLRQSEEKYRSILENMEDGYFEVDTHGSFTFVNDAMCNMFNYTKYEFIGLNYKKYLSEETAKKLFNMYNTTFLYGGKGQFYDYEITIKNGEKRYISTSFNLLYENGKKKGFRGIVRDITEKKRAERAQLESEEKYRFLIENASEIIYKCDLKGRFKYVNTTAQKLLGYTNKEILNQNYINFIDPEYRDQVLQFYIDNFKEKNEETYQELPIIKKDGSIIWLSPIVKLVKDNDDNFEYHCVARDITEKKRIEHALAELNKQKSKFFTNISHEIRTPLTLILSPIEAALQGDYRSKVDKKFLTSIQRNAIRLLKLINNILDLSKIEAGKMTINVKEADIVKFIKNYISTVQPTAETRGIKIEFCSLNEKIDNLHFDLEKMDRIIMNLFSNALKFTEKGGEIRIHIKEDEKNCYIEFEDTGIGIPANKIDIIFDRFSQVDYSATRSYEGTGIGLSLVNEFVNLHGGTISVKSRWIEDNPHDHGTTFIIQLLKGNEHFEAIKTNQIKSNNNSEIAVPKHRYVGMREMHELWIDEDSSSSSNIKKDTPVFENQNSEKKDISILVVEDNDDMRNFLQSILNEYYNVYFAVNGAEGISRAAHIKPNLIITDVMMPVMDGFEMTKNIKSDKNLKEIPIIMLTAKSELIDKIDGLEQGADDYLYKPFNPNELLARIKTFLRIYTYQKIIANRNKEIEEELEIAKLIQHKLLPQEIPEISGYKSYVVYIPMDTIGGDFYDFSAMDNSIELFIADVSGHGLHGAFLSLITKMSLQNIRTRNSTSRVLYQINDVICRSTVKNNYVTSFFGIIDIHTNIIKYSNAGHLPPLVYRGKNNEFLELQAKGTPLGWFTDIKLGEQEIKLIPGDRLIIYTDGITECINAKKEMFGQDNFKNFIKTNRHLSPQSFSETLIKHLKNFAGSDKFEDDLTLIVFDVL